MTFVLNFTKIRDVKSPIRAHATDAGIDFFIPNDFEEVLMRKGDSVLIPLGIKVSIPEGYVLMAGNKSGVSLKKGLIFGGGIIDSGYEGEISIQMIKVCEGTDDNINTGGDHDRIFLPEYNETKDTRTVILKDDRKYTKLVPGEKIIQFMLVKICNTSDNAVVFKENRNEDFLEFCNSTRGSGGYGSTGNF